MKEISNNLNLILDFTDVVENQKNRTMFAGINWKKKKYPILFLVAFRRVRVFINIKRISNELVKIHTEVNFFDCVILWDYLLYCSPARLVDHKVLCLVFSLQWCALIRDALIRDKSLFSEKFTGH